VIARGAFTPEPANCARAALIVGVALLELSADRRFEIERASGTVRLLVQGLAHRPSDE
jgi:hypothetical protein